MARCVSHWPCIFGTSGMSDTWWVPREWWHDESPVLCCCALWAPHWAYLFKHNKLIGKEPACQCRRYKRCRFDPWVRKVPWRRKWQPAPLFLSGKSHGQRSLVGYIHEVAKNQTWLKQLNNNNYMYVYLYVCVCVFNSFPYNFFPRFFALLVP